ncbi:DUF3558 family protein [Pseudonocardia humida]|uniref:DUF3558 family protein n=1 Tax=Pseudonocardia humida TaxID=2800819 RepID=A0ABT1A6G2_9PSEU|nr:DUF3558 family protein [Pseudonocardia humida]MCO1658599.1 DUF3558 family protein [Pseudonocardia humida]
MRSTLSRVFVPVALAALLLAGCSSTVTGSAAPEGGGPSVPGDLAEAQQQAEDIIEGGAPQESLDVCALLPAAEVEALLGPGVTGVPNDGINGNVCAWENPDTYNSVTLEIGRPGTAAGGQLPPWDATVGEERSLGDGMREGPGGGVQFVAGDRDCFLQVVTEDLGGSEDEATAIELAQQVRGTL